LWGPLHITAVFSAAQAVLQRSELILGAQQKFTARLFRQPRRRECRHSLNKSCTALNAPACRPICRCTPMATDALNISASMLPRRNALAVASWLLLLIWLSWSACAFWFMELRDWRSVGRAAFDNVDAAQVEQWYRSNSGTASHGAAPLTLVHLYNPGCPCNRFIEPQLRRLIEHYQPLGVRILAASARTAGTPAPLELPAIHASDGALASAGIKSSPAALIFDANGRLIYYGPYSDSAWCGGSGTLVEPVLDRALIGLAAERRPRASRGCFCGW
jgi:Domain of unknown function (DUF6436)